MCWGSSDYVFGCQLSPSRALENESKEGRENSEFEAKSIVDTVTKSKRTDERHIKV
jgi:hypothetical protein